MNQKGFTPVVIVLIILGILILGGIGYYTVKKFQKPNQSEQIVGGDRDAHGCIGSAGYSWCGVKQKCLRVWEEKCEADATANRKIYTDTQNGFKFEYPTDEKVVMLNTSVVFQNNAGQKIISLQIKNIQDVSNISCVQGKDTKCNNISADGHNIIVQYGMLGNIVARVDLSKEKSLLFSLSCDSMEKYSNGENIYCQISDQRAKKFLDSLFAFRFTK